MSFQIHALDNRDFTHLFALNDEALRQQNARRIKVTEYPGTPCRISLEDAGVGETVILANYEHMTKRTPFRASHAIFLREGLKTATPEINEIPGALRTRMLSLRGFDQNGMMLDADLADGKSAQRVIMRLFENPLIDELHIHYAKQGCYAARATCP